MFHFVLDLSADILPFVSFVYFNVPFCTFQLGMTNGSYKRDFGRVTFWSLVGERLSRLFYPGGSIEGVRKGRNWGSLEIYTCCRILVRDIALLLRYINYVCSLGNETCARIYFMHVEGVM